MFFERSLEFGGSKLSSLRDYEPLSSSSGSSSVPQTSLLGNGEDNNEDSDSSSGSGEGEDDAFVTVNATDVAAAAVVKKNAGWSTVKDSGPPAVSADSM
jgi:hypothetical protein